MQQKKDPLRFLAIIDRLNERLGTVVSYGVVFLMCIVVYEVVARYVFNSPTFWAHETSAMLFGAFILLGSSYTLCRRTSPQHIKMDVIFMRFSPRGKAIVDLFTSLTFFTFIGVLIWKSWDMAYRATKMHEGSASEWAPPVYPIKWILFAGVCLLLIMGIVRFIRNFVMATTGKEAP